MWATRTPIEYILEQRFPALTAVLHSALQEAAAEFGASWTDDKVIDHVRRRFCPRLDEMWPDHSRRLDTLAGLACQFGSVSPEHKSREIWRRFVADVQAEKEELLKLPAGNLNKLYWTESDTTDDFLVDDFVDEEIDQPGNPDLEAWFSKEIWRPLEAALLLMDMDPRETTQANVARAGKSGEAWAKGVLNILDNIERAQKTGSLENLLEPSKVVEWARGRIDLPIPMGPYRVFAPKFANYMKKNVDLERENAELRSEILRLQAVADEESIHPRSLISFYSMILTMAIMRYKHPVSGNSEAISNIKNDAEKLGINIGKTAIKSNLDKAFSKLSDAINKHQLAENAADLEEKLEKLRRENQELRAEMSKSSERAAKLGKAR